MSKNINLETLKGFTDDYLKNPQNTVIRHSLSKSKLNDACFSLDEASLTDFTFSTDIKTLPVSNQKQSGRCWIFSACNVLRNAIAKSLNINSMFELSQNYVAFYDKLEKINYLLEAIIERVDKSKDDRTNMFLLQNAISDGGQWDMFVNIIKKYGIVPKANMVETCQSSFTMQMNRLINNSIREFASEANKIYNSNKDLDKIRKLKDEYLEKFYSLLCSCFGIPPKSFNFEYVDALGIYHIEKDLTPTEFYNKYIASFIDDYVSIIHAPTDDKEYMKTYTIEYLGNVIEGKKVTHLNLPLNRIKELIIKQLKDDNLVWFGSDVSNYGVREIKQGLWDDKHYDFKTPFGLDLSFDKKDMLDFYASCMNHAMVITGVNIVNDKPNRWKIENSWGEEVGNKGFFVMSDSFFDKFVYQAAILKKYLSKEELKALKQEPIVLKPWDPFGTLAD